MIRKPCEGSPKALNRRDVDSLLQFLAPIAEIKNPGWLAKAMDDPGMAKHPFVRAYREVDDLLQETDANFSQSYSLIWLMRLANDWGSLLDVVPADIRSSSRLQSDVDCESLKYELFVMASYKKRGANVVSTDQEQGKAGECKVTWGNGRVVYIECKRKSTRIIRRRDSEANFRELQKRIFHLMEELNRPATTMICSRYDPTDDDIPRVLAHVERLLKSSQNPIGSERDGKLFIEVGAPPIEETAPGEYALTMPHGLDFGCSQEIRTPSGEPDTGMCFGWRTEQRVRWIRSAISALKKAANQLPQDEPGVVYLEVPQGPPAVVWLRVKTLADEVRQVLQHEHQRIAAVVVSGECQWMKTYTESDDSTAFVSAYYEVVENSNTRNPLPGGFQLFGRDFDAFGRDFGPNSLRL